MSDDNSKLSLLMEAGFLAAAMGMTAKAIVIFSALRLVRPDSEAPILGLALTFVNMGRFRDAAQLLSGEGFKKNPDSDLLRAMLGLTFQLAGREDEDVSAAIPCGEWISTSPLPRVRITRQPPR